MSGHRGFCPHKVITRKAWGVGITFTCLMCLVLVGINSLSDTLMLDRYKDPKDQHEGVITKPGHQELRGGLLDFFAKPSAVKKMGLFDKTHGIQTFKMVTFLTGDAGEKDSSLKDCVILPHPKTDDVIASYNSKEVEELYQRVLRFKVFLESYPDYLKMSVNAIIKGVKNDEIPVTKQLGQDLLYIDELRTEIVTQKTFSFESDNYQLLLFSDLLKHLGTLRQRDFPTFARPLVCDNCFKFDFKRIFVPHKIYQTSDVTILALVTSRAENRTARDAIRSTWGGLSTNGTMGIKVIFLIGNPKDENLKSHISRENDKYGDILMEDYNDSFYNLTYKVLGGYKWVNAEFPQATFILTTSDQVYVHLPSLSHLLNSHGPSPGLQRHLVGRCCVGHFCAPYRTPEIPEYISTREYSLDAFPPYPDPPTFLLSRALLSDVIQASPSVPYFPLHGRHLGLLLQRLDRGCRDVREWTRAVTSYTEMSDEVDRYVTYETSSPRVMWDLHRHLHGSSGQDSALTGPATQT